jgi:hypothetical protein
MRRMSAQPLRFLGFFSVAGLAVCGLTLGALSLSQSGCPGGGSTTDMGTPSRDLAFSSCCGKAGEAVLCSFAAAPQKKAYFCTIPCNPDMGTTACGEGAVCQFDSAFGAYGCVPSACLASLPAGCSL